jgi:aldehyde dehydrogenase (NAD+)
MWHWGTAEGSSQVEKLSAGNLKQTWVNHGRQVAWDDPDRGEGEPFLRHATQVKNIWVPYGE